MMDTSVVALLNDRSDHAGKWTGGTPVKFGDLHAMDGKRSSDRTLPSPPGCLEKQTVRPSSNTKAIWRGRFAFNAGD
jgi:hypothetical protein